MKKIVIMGGGINQIPLIEAAHNIGYTTVLCDGYDNPAGKPKADMFFVLIFPIIQKQKK